MLEPNSGVSKEMDKTIAKYFLGEITYREAIDIVYPIHLENVKKLEEIISERKRNKLRNPEQDKLNG